MPALSFQKQFADAVERGDKRQTIRAPRARPIPVGAKVFLYTGQRTKSCRKLGEAMCKGTSRIIITDEGRILVDGTPLDFKKADAFAHADGFPDEAALIDWFEKTHGLPFEGVLIEWGTLWQE